VWDGDCDVPGSKTPDTSSEEKKNDGDKESDHARIWMRTNKKCACTQIDYDRRPVQHAVRKEEMGRRVPRCRSSKRFDLDRLRPGQRRQVTRANFIKRASLGLPCHAESFPPCTDLTEPDPDGSAPNTRCYFYK
jgi:hypothetical protein